MDEANNSQSRRTTEKKAGLIGRFLFYPTLFFAHAGSAAYFVLFLVLLSGITEILGISMILPIIELTDDTTAASPLTQYVLAAVRQVGLSPKLETLLGLVVIIFLLKGAIMFWQAYMLERASVMLSRSLQGKLMSGLSSASYRYFTRLESGATINLLFRETTRFSSGFVRYVGLWATLIYILIYFTFATVLSLPITILVISLGFVALIFMWFAARRTRHLSQMITKSYGDAQSFIIQILNGFLYFKATGAMEDARSRSIDGFDLMAKLNRAMALINAGVGNITEPLAVLMLAGLIFFQVSLYERPVGEVFVLAIVFYRAFGRLVSVQLDWQKFNRSLGGVEIVQNYFQKFAKNQEIIGDKPPPEVNLDIVLDNVSYTYANKPVVKNLSLTIRGSTSVGIVGESGAGKSTLFLLIAGILRPSSGSIKLGGVDYTDFDIESLRRKIGFVTQEPAIITDTIANNINLWHGDGSDPEIRSRIIEAAEQAHCMEFISELPDGLDTIVGERGATLSGGQKQRIAIARELFKKPGLIIFDEATSALDGHSEKIVRDSIDALRNNRTMIMIAHRLSTIRQCDEIVVLSKGEMVETGRFEDLANDPGARFYELLKNQRL
ncbi:MAG: ABC transporter ATP-binding protein [Rhodospirillales bacterium]|jgi:ABC-type multidrug transport system fused ATPase/permease subunit|nr:ABC transporter ATP-binding protein [Rhodospirillales bacterium]MBT4626122.1 ABC transporter ATP-binding protein [Rhodospirillales bacterium]MBT5522262.1 ABC transporter ATP-binding protein [Rhodospirillales bacterium]MBT6109381.1 ABC transporter ATP-binding protein [Rhodospirillales bacterium]